MPTIVPAQWACDVCSEHYFSEYAARACEARLEPVESTGFPQGLIVTTPYLDRRPDAPLCAALVIDFQANVKHVWDIYVYSFTPRGSEDTTHPRRNCIVYQPDPSPHYHVWGHPEGTLLDTDVSTPTFLRALAKCRTLGWTPRVIRGGCLVPYVDGDPR